jgi:toxin YhaV
MSRSLGRSRSDRDPPDRKDEPVASPIQAHGWSIFIHPSFLDQVDRLVDTVDEERERHPARYADSVNLKVLSAIVYLAFDLIPQDPSRKEYRQGQTLGDGRKHWFRAKFGGGRFRLFFRFRSDVRIIVYAWVNDEDTLRTYGSRTDAYAEFSRRLSSGNPPDDWHDLLGQASTADVVRRTEAASRRIAKLRDEPGQSGSSKKRK